ncbi:hypothetical protein ABT340_31830 [Streptosporangium sp. NPDC000239]|uniref:hypothetical protein n=1 Tax=Streptosporangium sp. NPDC000239 TaxID=3154248 RepID=UPI00332E5C38
MPVSTSHGGWAAPELADRLGSVRVPRVAVGGRQEPLGLPASAVRAVLPVGGLFDPRPLVRTQRHHYDVILDLADADSTFTRALLNLF